MEKGKDIFTIKKVFWNYLFFRSFCIPATAPMIPNAAQATTIAGEDFGVGVGEVVGTVVGFRVVGCGVYN